MDSQVSPGVRGRDRPPVVLPPEHGAHKIYTFFICRLDGVSSTFSTCGLPHDGATIKKATELLQEHLNCDHIDVWQGERPVAGVYRFQPVIRPISQSI